ncbi:MAG: hypothetical protein QF552_13505 [Litorilituus sp.]|jgi:hypothetical protein|nr:hypothetical protein [Litorilituus sp.]
MEEKMHAANTEDEARYQKLETEEEAMLATFKQSLSIGGRPGSLTMQKRRHIKPLRVLNLYC